MKSVSLFSVWVVFLFTLPSISWGANGHFQGLKDDTRSDYFSKVMLKTQDNKDVNFYDLIKGKIVVINFMYTRCDGKLCTQGVENLIKLSNALGDRLGREVFIYSITLDPEHDTPEVLKAYTKSHGVKPGWTFLTGNTKDITELRRRLGLYRADTKLDEDRTQHSGMIKIYNEALNKSESTSVLSKPERILEMIGRVQAPKPSVK